MANMRFTYEYVELLSVYDGDTVTLAVDLGLETRKVPLKIRLYGINAPELRTARGPASRDRLIELLTGAKLTLTTFKNKRTNLDKTEKFGRYLGVITAVRDSGEPVNVNQAMLVGGFADPYMETESL